LAGFVHDFAAFPDFGELAASRSLPFAVRRVINHHHRGNSTVLSVRLRTTAAVAALALGGVLFSAGAAQAVDTTIVVQSEDGVVFADEPLEASGTCTDGSTSAVVTVEVEGDVVAEDSVDVATDGTWESSLDVSDAEGDATVTVDCFVYADGDPVGSASADVYILALPDLEVIDVTVSPSKVRIGAKFTVRATCPAGTDVAAIAVGNEESEDAFLYDSVAPAANGAVTYTGTIPKGARTGAAIALVACGIEDLEAVFNDPDNEELPTAFGVGDFTILAAAVAAPAPAPAAAAPTLPETGSDNLPLAGLGAALVLVGVGAYGARRRTA
jgi:LPXTG-motif cell wall-anchored protein